MSVVPSIAAGVSGLTMRTCVNSAFAQIYSDMQGQGATAFTTGGAAPAFTLTPAPALTAYAVNQRFSVTFNAAGTTGSNTLNVSGLGAISLMQYVNGAKVAARVVSGMVSDVFYDGTNFVLLNPVVSGASTVGAFRNLALSATGSSYAVSVSADELVLEDANNNYFTARSVAASISVSASKANGLDTGSAATSTWYSVWLIYNGSTVSGLVSLSSTSPTLPSGYTFKARVGWIRTGPSTAYPLAFQQYGRRVQYKVGGGNLSAMPVMASGSAGSATTPSWSYVYLSSFVPSTAVAVTASAYVSNNGGQVIFAPNGSYGGSSSSTNPPPVMIQSSSLYENILFSLGLESLYLYYASNNSALVLSCLGWEDNL
jgi:hypothetical protein